jgi:internalin A
MRKKPGAIKRLEKRLGKKLKQMPLEDIMPSEDNGFAIDRAGSLKGLNLYKAKISDISFLEEDTFNDLTHLELSYNELSDVSSLSGLTGLMGLDLNSNKLSDLGALSELTGLTDLNLYSNKLSDVAALSGLTWLIRLDLSFNQVSDVAALSGLTGLMRLDLSSNQVSDVAALSELTGLKELSLSSNQVSDVTALSGLTGLTYLDLNSNKLSDVAALSELTGLTYLDLNSNKLSDVAPLSGLTELTVLNIGFNQVSDVAALSGLTGLTYLDLYSNKLSDVAALSGLTGLTHLDLRNNNISQLPQGILELKISFSWDSKHSSITLKGNPLESPPVEIVKQGDEAVRHYFAQIKEKETVRLLETKLLIVGNGEVGKTTLMRKLLDNKFEVETGKEATTEGIEIHPWDIQCPFPDCKDETVKVHLWDFGGQEIYHSTHQFFLTKRSLYLFVWEARKEEEAQTFDYWLNVINLLGKESPVIMVMNKSDVRIKHLDEANYKSKFKNIVGYEQVSCVNSEGITKLTEAIINTLTTMPHLQDLLPMVWKQIRDRLKEDTRDYISLNDYYAICKEFGQNREEATFLSNYLHDLGVILHYHDNVLEEMVILNPEWATEAVYKLIDTLDIQVNKGRFQFRDLKMHWDLNKFPVDKHHELVQLMEKFELCFKIVGEPSYIIPELLPPDRPGINFEKYQQGNNLCFQYEYIFMPGGIISRFISRLYYLIHKEHFWKNGVEMHFEQATALVLSEPLDRKITIRLAGSGQSELLAIIRQDFEHIHETLNMERDDHYKELIPCNCDRCREKEKPYLFSYATLKRRLDKNIMVERCGISDDEMSIASLLRGVEPEKPVKPLDFLEVLQLAGKYLQGISQSIKHQEDNRNDFITSILRLKGITVHDQTRWGVSGTGKSIGHLDFKLEHPQTKEESIVEAFNLDSLTKDVIKSHLQKLFIYDANGLKRNFILVYCGAKQFQKTWMDYFDYIRTITFEHPLQEWVEESSEYADIKLARAVHLRSEKATEVYHIFINMPASGGPRRGT